MSTSSKNMRHFRVTAEAIVRARSKREAIEAVEIANLADPANVSVLDSDVSAERVRLADVLTEG